MTDIEQALESLEKAKKCMDELPTPSEDLSVAVKQAEKALESLKKARQSIEDLEQDDFYKYTTNKIEKLAQKFEIKSIRSTQSRKVSEK